MKIINIHLKMVAFFISSMILLHGCTVYKSTNVTLNEAYKSQTKVKILTTDNETLIFKRINLVDGKYYGVNKKVSQLEDVPLYNNSINSIRILNKTASTALNVGIPLIIVGGIIWIAAESVTIDPGFDGI